MKTVLAIIAEARDKYTVHECSECTCRKSCDMNAYGFDTPECKGKRESIALALGVDDGYFTQILDRLEAAAKRDCTEIEANALAIGAAKLREALVKCADIINNFGLAEAVNTPMEVICDIEGVINAALAAPADESEVAK